MTIRNLLIAACLWVYGNATAATIPAASASYADVNAAVGLASSGDTVTVPAGSASWASILTLNKAITLKGAGKTLTHILNVNPTPAFYGKPALIEVTTGGTYRVTGFDLNGNVGSGGQCIVFLGSSQAGRVDNCYIHNAFTWGCYAAPGSYTGGVIDHNVMENNAQDFSYNSDNQTAWTRANNIGTTNCWVLEQNYFAKTSSTLYTPILGGGLYGGKSTWRYNVASNLNSSSFDQFIDAHGNQGGPNLTSPNSLRGIVFLETYGNLWYTLTANKVSQLRGGTQVHYANQIVCPTPGCNMVAFNQLYQMTEEDGFRNGNPVLTAWPGADGITNSYFFRNRLNGNYISGLTLQFPGSTPCPIRNCDTCQCPGPNPASDTIFIQSGRDFSTSLPTLVQYTPLSSPHPRIVADNDPPIPPTFALSAPSNGATGVSVQPTLSWADTTLETGYAVMVATDPYFSTMVVSNVVAANTTSYVVPGGLLVTNTLYYYRVWALGANGFNSSANAPFTFTTGTTATPGSIQLSAMTYSVNENGGSLTVIVKRVGGSSGAVGVSYATANGTATSGVNYTSTSGTKSWAGADSADKTFTIPVNADGACCADLQFTVSVSAPTGGATLGSPTSATVTIVNTDPPPGPPLMTGLSFHAYQGLISSPGQTNASGYFFQSIDTDIPGNGGRVAARFTIVDDFDYNIGATVRGDTPSNNSLFVSVDAEPMAPTMIWPINPLTTGMQFRMVDWLGNGTVTSQFVPKVWHLTPGVHTLYIRGREANTFLDLITISKVPTPGVIQLASAVYSFNDSAGTVLIPVRRTAGTSGTVGVSYATANGSGVSGVNYTAASGTLSWVNGDSADKSIPITILNTHVNAPDTDFTVTVSSPTGSATLGTPTTATITVFNTTPPVVPPVTPGAAQFASASYSVNENAGNIVLTVKRVLGTDHVVTVNYATVPGTAHNGINYTVTAGTLTWPSGNADDKTINVPILNDGVFTPDLAFTVALSSQTGGLTLGDPAIATVNVLNVNPDPGPPPVPQQFGWEFPGYTGTAGDILLATVRRFGGITGEVSVVYSSVDGTAQGGIDYVPTSGTLTFTQGEAFKTIALQLINNVVPQIGKYLYLRLSNAAGGTINDPADALIVINNLAPTLPPLPPIIPGSTNIIVFRGTVILKGQFESK